ncbi:hypothetical protein EGW08_002558, partial [Elysia chlorotica]
MSKQKSAFRTKGQISPVSASIPTILVDPPSPKLGPPRLRINTSSDGQFRQAMSRSPSPKNRRSSWGWRTPSPRRRSASPFEDLSAFAMPLIDPNSGDSSMMNDSGDFGPAPRARSGSGASALKGLLSSGSKARSGGKASSDDKEGKEKKDKDKKKGGFFEAFRPRSKSDVSGLKRPVRKPAAIPTEHSVDEATLSVANAVGTTAVGSYHQKTYGGSQELATPMGQILEGKMLQVDADRNRHKSGPGQAAKISPGALKEGGGGFMNKLQFRTRSNSDSKPKSPRRPLQFQ